MDKLGNLLQKPIVRIGLGAGVTFLSASAVAGSIYGLTRTNTIGGRLIPGFGFVLSALLLWLGIYLLWTGVAVWKKTRQ